MPFRNLTGAPGRSLPQKFDRRKFLFSYAPDWLLTIVLAAAFLFLDSIDGFKREFSVSDSSYGLTLFPSYAIHERVPDALLYAIAFLAPLLLMWLINFATIRVWWDSHNSALGLVLSLSLAGAFTQAIKVTVGRPRPDLLDRCNPDSGVVDPPYGLSSVAICHQSDRHIINDGFRSFPSGHSSLSFAGLTFLSLYIAGKLHLFDTRGHAPKAWIAGLPLFGAALIAVTRTMDNRHHWHDVIAGSFLGIVTAYFAYRQYFPSLESEFAHLPYGPRTQHLEGTHGRPAPGLPYYQRSRGSESGDADVELLHDTVRRDEPHRAEAWERASSLEGGPHSVEDSILPISRPLS
ncbi:phosphatidic acid phosphatase type 2/haloperoxidase [Russula earlei]|uniref:Phosphatidic acid phosphatase type 2/haloperoxidase n=1 Tax=Russula earlei TaxID=71964 RepID=A0ACC0UFG9_9AGAM|nr:phosphatidic acid phosphatase type 2/haloperoxidase [Russula earlei]